MFEFSTCQSLVCGAGVSKQLPEIAGKLGIKKILVVTDPGLIKTGLVERVTAPLAEGSVQPVSYTHLTLPTKRIV